LALPPCYALGLSPILSTRPRLAGDAVTVAIVLRVVAGLASVGGCQADGASRSAVRRRRGVPEGHRRRPPPEVRQDRIGEGSNGDRGERRNASLVPVPAKPCDRATTRAASAERVVPAGPHGRSIAAASLRNRYRPFQLEITPPPQVAAAGATIGASYPLPGYCRGR
jgi:hypothetical protein